MNLAFKEGMKEFARMAAISVVPVLIASLEGGESDIKAIVVAVTIALLRAVDSFIHHEESLKSTGLVNMVTGGKVTM